MEVIHTPHAAQALPDVSGVIGYVMHMTASSVLRYAKAGTGSFHVHPLQASHAEQLNAQAQAPAGKAGYTQKNCISP